MPPARASDPHEAVLLVSCPDRRGIVAALAQVLHGHGANILDADQHTDPVAGQFFQRIRFDLSDLFTDRVSLERGIGEVAERFAMRFQLAYGNERKRVALFVSRVEHCLLDLLWRHRARELPLLREQRIDLVVMARYMQILSSAFVDQFPARIINIHHSFLPAFQGGKPYHQASERGVKLIGATAHYATTDLDEGPIIEQDVARTTHRDSIDDLVRKGRDLERTVLARAVRWHLEDRILVHENKTVVFG